MTDRITAVVAVPVDPALPLDVQGVGLRRVAIERMQEIATIDENTVRMKNTSDSAYVDLGSDVGTISLWQLGLMAALFTADGRVSEGVVGNVVHRDHVTRLHSLVQVVRDPHK